VTGQFLVGLVGFSNALKKLTNSHFAAHTLKIFFTYSLSLPVGFSWNEPTLNPNNSIGPTSAVTDASKLVSHSSNGLPCTNATWTDSWEVLQATLILSVQRRSAPEPGVMHK
jgi:hypothetical protein